MKLNHINRYFGNIDIVLFDLILQNKFHAGMKVMDAGCGEGRNLMYFLNAGYSVYGADSNPAAINALRFISGSVRPDLDRDHYQVAEIDNLPFGDHAFDLVLAVSVLHFARSRAHFADMLGELLRCTAYGGTLFLKMDSNIGIEEKVTHTGDGLFRLPDGSRRFLLTRERIEELTGQSNLALAQPWKSEISGDQRSTSTLLLTIV